MQIPQYERRPREIPTYKPLQENWRFANPYPASIEVGRAPIGEALGTIGRGLSDAWGRLQKMEDESYFQVMLPKTLIVAAQAEEDAKLHGNTDDTEYVAKSVSYIDDSIKKAWGDADFGYDPKKTEINKKIMEIVYNQNIVPSIATFSNIHAKAMIEKGQRNTALANKFYIEAGSQNQKAYCFDIMDSTGKPIKGITSENPWSTVTGTALEVLKPALTSTEKSFRDGLLTADRLESTKEQVIEDALVQPNDDRVRYMKLDIDIIQGLDCSKQENVDKARAICHKNIQFSLDSEDQLNKSSILVVRYPDGSYDGEVLYNMTADQIAARRHYWETRDPSNPPQVEIVTKENMSLEAYNKIMDNYSTLRGQFIQYLESIRLQTKGTKAGSGYMGYNPTSLEERLKQLGQQGGNGAKASSGTGAYTGGTTTTRKILELI